MAALTHIALWTTQLETLRDFYVHVRSKEEVDRQVELFRRDGYAIVGEPRTSGDGYYEGVILDPDGNRVELVAFGEPEIVPAHILGNVAAGEVMERCVLPSSASQAAKVLTIFFTSKC